MAAPGIARRMLGSVQLAGIFVYELALSSFAVAKAALAPRSRMRTASAIVAVPIQLRTDLGIAVLANLVTLTPGTCSLHVSDDRRILYVHALDAESPEAVIASIRRAFERRIAEIEG